MPIEFYDKGIKVFVGQEELHLAIVVGRGVGQSNNGNLRPSNQFIPLVENPKLRRRLPVAECDVGNRGLRNLLQDILFVPSFFWCCPVWAILR